MRGLMMRRQVQADHKLELFFIALILVNGNWLH